MVSLISRLLDGFPREPSQNAKAGFKGLEGESLESKLPECLMPSNKYTRHPPAVRAPTPWVPMEKAEPVIITTTTTMADIHTQDTLPIRRNVTSAAPRSVTFSPETKQGRSASSGGSAGVVGSGIRAEQTTQLTSSTNTNMASNKPRDDAPKEIYPLLDTRELGKPVNAQPVGDSDKKPKDDVDSVANPNLNTGDEKKRVLPVPKIYPVVPSAPPEYHHDEPTSPDANTATTTTPLLKPSEKPKVAPKPTEQPKTNDSTLTKKVKIETLPKKGAKGAKPAMRSLRDLEDDENVEWFTVEKVRNGLYKIREVFYENSCNIWLIKGPGKDIIIDPGLGVVSLRDFLVSKKLINENDPPTVICTHIHFDHVGGANEFQDVYIHEDSVEALEEGLQKETLNFVQSIHFYKMPFPGFKSYMYRVEPTPCEPLKHGDQIQLGGNEKLDVIAVPGHTKGCIALYNSLTMELFTGDFIYDCGGGEGLIDWLHHSSISTYVESAHKMLQWLDKHEVHHVYTGHFANMTVETMRVDLNDYIADRSRLRVKLSKRFVQASSKLFFTLNCKKSCTILQ